MPWPSKLSRGCPMTMPLWASIPAHNPNAWISTRVCGGPREAHCGRIWRSTRLAVSWPDDGGAWTCSELSRGHFVGAGGAVSWTPSNLAWPVRGRAWRLRGQVWACCGHTWTCSGPPSQCAWPYLEARGRIVDAYRGPTPDHVDVRRGRASSRAARLRCVDVPLDTRSYFLSSKRQKEGSLWDPKKGEKDFLRIICIHKKVALPLCQISV